MTSTIILAFDQHAATTVAAVLLPGQRTSALHTLTSDSATIVRFVPSEHSSGTKRAQGGDHQDRQRVSPASSPALCGRR